MISNSNQLSLNLVNAADTALYQGKKEGRYRYHLCHFA